MSDEIIGRFRQLFNYKPKKGMRNESFGDVDTSNYICIGEVPYDPWLKNLDKVYIMVSPHKIMRWGEERFDVRYTENSDGSGLQTSSIPGYVKENAIIYPEHQDDEYGELFLGKKKSDEEIKAESDEFESRLFKKGNNVIIHHNTSYKVEDGVIKRGKQNAWSNNSDIGIYFWGSRNSGKDPSSVGSYTYYCLIERENLYDFHTNVERLSLKQALGKYGYVGQIWQNGDAIVVNTLKSTPIWCILDNKTGKWYDKEWNEIEKPF